MTLEQLKTIEIGDVVVLNSGGPNMTVYEIDHSWIKANYWNEIKQQFDNITMDYAELRKVEKGK